MVLASALVAMLGMSSIVSAEETMYVPIPSYRVGPYAAGGTGYFGGILDYYNLLNSRGGIGGVKLIWSECETEYSVERGVECYKRLKDREGGAVFFDPLSVGISTALIETGRADKMPIIAVNHGKTAGQRGDIFPYEARSHGGGPLQRSGRGLGQRDPARPPRARLCAGQRGGNGHLDPFAGFQSLQGLVEQCKVKCVGMVKVVFVFGR